MESIEHNEMFLRHSSMAYVQEGRPLDLELEGADDLNRCEGKLLYDQKHVVFLPHTYGYGFFEGPNNSCIILLPSLYQVFLFVYISPPRYTRFKVYIYY